MSDDKMPNQPAAELLPCPWCGITPSIFDHSIAGIKDEWSVYCKGEMCAVAPSTTGEFRQHAVSQWNNQTVARTRTPSDAAVELFECLENLLGDLYLIDCGEIKRGDMDSGSRQDALKALGRFQRYRKERG